MHSNSGFFPVGKWLNPLSKFDFNRQTDPFEDFLVMCLQA